MNILDTIVTQKKIHILECQAIGGGLSLRMIFQLFSKHGIVARGRKRAFAFWCHEDVPFLDVVKI